jgi:hypothetical protein
MRSCGVHKHASIDASWRWLSAKLRHPALVAAAFCNVHREDRMKSLAICATLIGGFGALVFIGTVASTVPASAKCMVDEGNGRRTPCDALYKTNKKPVAKASKTKTMKNMKM